MHHPDHIAHLPAYIAPRLRRVLFILMLLPLLALTARPAQAGAENPRGLKFVSSPGKSVVTLSGTSNLHDWQAHSNTLNGFIRLASDYRKILHPGDKLSTAGGNCPISMALKIPVRSFRSAIPGLSEQVWKELNEKKYPHIVVRLKSGVFLEKAAPNTYRFKFRGVINADGVDSDHELLVTVSHPDETKLILEGETMVRMTDFNITPPTYMDGVVKAGDKVKVNVRWVLDHQTVR